MAETVKRNYHSPLRADAARRTRAQIRDAAALLFVAQGFVATTVREVAAAAGVSPRTVHATFPGGKTELFHEALNVATVGYEAPVALADRPQWTEILAEPDGRRAIELLVDLSTDLLERAGPLIMAGLRSAGADPDMRRLADEGANAPLTNLRSVARALHRHSQLRAGLSTKEAAATLHVLSSPLTHDMLRRQLGWSAAHYRRWLVDILSGALLGTIAPGS